MINTVIFDMDGTILDTLDDLTDAVNYALGVMGYPKLDRSEIRNHVGNGLSRLIEKSLPAGHDKKEEVEATALFKLFYGIHGNDKTKPYDGIIELLDALHVRGVKTAVLSNKYDAAVSELAEVYFPGKFDAVYGERQGIPKKPQPDAVNAIMEELGTDKAHTIYIGDSEVDMQTGNNAGVKTVGVTWGFRSTKILEENKAHHIIDEPMELLALL